MQCQNWSGTSGTDARLFVRSGLKPMASTHAEVEIDYDNPMWSKANYSECLDGDSYPTYAGTNDGVVSVHVDISDAHLR